MGRIPPEYPQPSGVKVDDFRETDWLDGRSDTCTRDLCPVGREAIHCSSVFCDTVYVTNISLLICLISHQPNMGSS